MKKLWIITGILVFIGIASGALYFYSQKNTKVISPAGQIPLGGATPTPSVELTTWNDPAGFSIQYPKDLTVNTHANDDNVNYAHYELTDPAHPGSVIVWVSDLPGGVTTLDGWMKKFYPSATSLDTTLGGEAAKKILVASSSAKFVVGTISDGLLFYIDGTLTDKPYWQSVEDTVVKSFTFTWDTPAAASNPSAGDQSVDEQEVLQ